MESVFREVQSREEEALNALFASADRRQMRRACEMLRNASFTVSSACGVSGFTARAFAYSLCSASCPAQFLTPSDALRGGLGILRTGDVLLLLSREGDTAELISAARAARARGARIIVVTEHADSPLARGADAVLLVPGCGDEQAGETALSALLHMLIAGIRGE